MSAVKAIYAGARALGIAEEDDRRDLFERVTGKRRLREMTRRDKEAVVAEMRRLGFQGAPRKAGGLQGPYAKKFQALWISAWNLGLVRNRSDQALLAFVRRQTGIEHTNWLHHADDARKVTEALKSWIAREGGVDWSEGRDVPGWCRDHGAKVAFAQWRKLNEAQQVKPVFAAAVADVMGDACGGLSSLTSADWREVCNDWGGLLRALAD